jgi:hypothetical protein
MLVPPDRKLLECLSYKNKRKNMNLWISLYGSVNIKGVIGKANHEVNDTVQIELCVCSLELD